MFKFLTYLVDVHNYSVIIMNVIITLSCYQNIEIESSSVQKKSACMRRTSPFTISSSNKYSGFRGSLWFLNYFCGEEKIKSDIFSATHCHELLCSPFFLFWCLLFHVPFSAKSHCPLAAFVITDSSLLSFILWLFSTSSSRSAIHAPHSWKTCIKDGCKKTKQNSSCTKQRSVFVCQFTQA